jgi:hypothetical protein
MIKFFTSVSYEYAPLRAVEAVELPHHEDILHHHHFVFGLFFGGYITFLIEYSLIELFFKF